MITLLAALIAAPAHAAGTVYVNGVRADALKDFDFKEVDVRIDEDGNVWIEAPQYRIEVQEPTSSANPDLKPGEGVPTGKYWLVTQDNQSKGHTIEVMVNGVVVKKIDSGQPQVILDLQPHLMRGVNNVTFNAMPGSPEGGLLLVYVGTGSQEGGLVQLDNPQITYTRRSSDSTKGGSKSYKLRVE